MEPTSAPELGCTVVLIGAAGSGKTMLVEALLLGAGAISRLGSIEQGTTVCDHEPEEIARGTTLSPALAFLSWNAGDATCRSTFVDTPGHPDFAGAVDAALAVADLVILTVSAVDGVTPGTRAAWASAEASQLPCIVVVTQEDRARASFRDALGALRAEFGERLWALELPVGEAQAFTGVADVLTQHVLLYDADGRHHDEPLPPELAEEEHRLHQEVTEEIVSRDDDQLEAYLDGHEPRAAELEHTLARAVDRREVVPVVVCSAATGTGVDHLLDLVCALAPPAAERDGRIIIGVDAEGTGASSTASRPTPRARSWFTCSAPWPTRSWVRSRC